MSTCKRWIAIVPTALAALVTFTGCKMGQKYNCGAQGNCATTCLTPQDSCGNSCSPSCLDGKGICKGTSTPCGSSPFCLGEKGVCQGKSTPCGSSPSCGTQCGGACGAKCGCKSSCGPDCKSQVSCASIACAIQPKANCAPKSECLPQSQTKLPYESMPYHEPAVEQPTPVEDFKPSVKEPMETEPMPMPMIESGDKAKAEKATPIPAPPTGDDAASQSANPFLTVAQTQAWDASATVPASHVPHRNEYPEMENSPRFTREQLQGPKTYSKAWADALGLPAENK